MATDEIVRAGQEACDNLVFIYLPTIKTDFFSRQTNTRHIKPQKYSIKHITNPTH